MRQDLRVAAKLALCRSGTCRQFVWRQDAGGRKLHISSISPYASDTLHIEPSRGSGSVTPDATFEVSEAPLPLLYISLSASQNLYTRRGTLVGIGGKADNVVSTLSVLGPSRRLVGGIPFLYQRVSSASPVTALIAPKSVVTSLAVVKLDGSTDWMVVGRSLLAWTGQTLSIKPTINSKMSLAHWGASLITGRGLLALAGRGSITQIDIGAGESYVAHPSNVVAYSMNRDPPLPYRLKASSLRLQIPDLRLSRFMPETKLVRVIRESWTWRTVNNIFHSLRTWFRRFVWGDRLFLEFTGPATILLQTRATRLNDALTSRDVNEIADTPAGLTRNSSEAKATRDAADTSQQVGISMMGRSKQPEISTASIGSDGKVVFTREVPNMKA